MGADKRAEVLFLLIVLLMLPVLYIIHQATKSSSKTVECIPVIYVDAGIPGDSVADMVHNDTAVCGAKCTSTCLAQIGEDCKGVYKAIYSNIYGVSCMCELYPVDKKYADQCIPVGNGTA